VGEDGDEHEVYRGGFFFFERFAPLRVCTETNSGGLGLLVSQLGAIRFDRDVRSVANFLSTQSSYGGAREKFTRLLQISTLLNLDAVSRLAW
jgi:hypothetical protein